MVFKRSDFLTKIIMSTGSYCLVCIPPLTQYIEKLSSKFVDLK